MRGRSIILLSLFVSVVLAGECKEKVNSLLIKQDFDAPPELFELCRKASVDGDVEAQYYFTFFYFGPLGDVYDEAKGIELVRKSADGGYPQAEYWMGWQSEQGNLLPRDESVALDWYRRAADSGFWMAMRRLQQAYENGELGLKPDKAKADQYRYECCNK